MRIQLLGALLLGVAITGCRNKNDESTDTSGIEDGDDAVDADNDGFTDGEDCDDDDPATNPDATEVCDGIDNDCDGTVDEGVMQTWYTDADGDDHGDPSTAQEACGQPAGTVSSGDDCDDSDADVYPGAPERCDGVDNNCNGSVDEDVQSTWYADADGDGFGDPASAVDDCDPDAGYVADASDCDDTDAAVNPEAQEVCNGVDDDCDGLLDDEDDSLDEATSWYADADSDGYGDAGSAVTACEQPSGTVADGSDCDDTDAAVNPGATELCNDVDDDCDGDVDEEPADAATWYLDSDADGYGDAAISATACEEPPGYTADGSDCDDTDPAVNPAAEEVCNGLDDDCDGDADEDGAGGSTWYADLDGDGYGDAGTSMEACTQPSGYVSDATDCDDGQASTNPGATETCDDVDNDCDSLVDDEDGSVSGRSWWYADADGDGYGNGTDKEKACDQPSGYVKNWRDCDDGDAAVNPKADEVCDGIDNDCDGNTDDADSDVTDAATWYADADSDGYGDASSSSTACEQPSGTVADDTDCDDGDAAVNPGAAEVCDGVDTDCDGDLSWLEDDGDGDGVLACNQALWIRTDGFTNNDPTGTGTYASSQAAAILADIGVDWDTDDIASTPLSDTWMIDYGILIFVGRGDYGPLDAAESAALEDWVSAGGTMLYAGYHPNATSCGMLNSLPSAFGISCYGYSTYWSGTATTITSHPVTDGVSSVIGLGGELWTVASPAETVVEYGGWPVVVAAEVGDGKVVGASDEWFLYDAGTNGSYDISAGDNEVLVGNIWDWLAEHNLE